MVNFLFGKWGLFVCVRAPKLLNVSAVTRVYICAYVCLCTGKYLYIFTYISTVSWWEEEGDKGRECEKSE